MNDKYTIIEASSKGFPMIGMRLDQINFNGKPWLTYVVIPFEKTDNGLPSEAESERLNQLEDFFLKEDSLLLVVRINYSGNRELYFHSEEMINLKKFEENIKNNQLIVQCSFDPNHTLVKSYFNS